jgi:hypothetical protein
VPPQYPPGYAAPPPPGGPPVSAPPGAYPQPPAKKKGIGTLGALGIAAGITLLLCCGIGLVSSLVKNDKPSTTTRDTAVDQTAPAADATTGAAPAVPAAPTTAAEKLPPPPAPDGPPTVKLGQKITVDGFGGSSEFTVRAGKQHTSAPQSSFFKPDNGIFYAAPVEIKAIKGSVYACPCDFALIAKDGTVYEGTIGIGFDNALDPAQLNAGQRTTGVVVFDVPKAALAGGRIELREGLGNQPRGYWQL